MPQPRIIYQDVAPEAKQEAVLTATNKEKYITLDDLNLGALTVPYFSTLEKDYWLLDGNGTLFPENPEEYHWGMVSETISGEDGVFALGEEPVLTINFTSLQTSIALTLDFDLNRDEWCNITVSYYNDDTEIVSYTYEPNTSRYCCVGTAELYNKVIITFVKTSIPYRRARLTAIFYGIIRNFSVDELSAVSALEEMNPISAELSINTMSFTVKNTSPIPFLFQKMQPVQLYYGDELIGTYFIDSSERSGYNQYAIEAVDSIGALDNYTYLGGMFDNQNVGELLEAIFTPIHLSYYVDETIKSKSVSGYLPICTVREALLQIAFAVGAIVDDSRSDTVNIKPLEDDLKKVFIDTEVRQGGKSKINQKLTAVEVTTYAYSTGTTEKEVFNGIVPAGESSIRLDTPCSDYTITGGTIIENGANYVTFTVEKSGAVVITGKEYVRNEMVYTKRNPELTLYDVENVKKVSGSTLVNSDNVEEVLERVYNYYALAEAVECGLILGDIKAGDRVTVPTPYNEVKSGRIISNSMTFGSKLRGQVKIIADNLNN